MNGKQNPPFTSPASEGIIGEREGVKVMKNLDLTPFEHKILELSCKPEITRHRRTMIIVFGLVFVAVLVLLALILQSWKLVLVIALLYIAMTLWEKVEYANAVLSYKSLIQKLKKRVEESKSRDNSIKL